MDGWEEGKGGRGAYFEHLDEGNIEVEIYDVATDETPAVENADGDDHAEIGSAVHADFFAPVQEGGCSGEDLGG